MARTLIGAADIGGTKILAAIVDNDGHVLGERRIATEPERGPEDGLARLLDALAGAAADAGVGIATLRALGVTIPGPIDPRAQVLPGAPNLPGWKNVPLGRMLRERSGLPVVVENDANAAALGEYARGAGRSTRDMTYITASTGIGGGIIANGRLVSGLNGAAGEVGHMVILVDGPMCGCGRRGCLEALASGTAIAREAARLIAEGRAPLLAERAGPVPTAKHVAEAAAAGDEVAQRLLDDAARYLGIGLMNLIHLLNPEAIVVGGGLTKIPGFLDRAAAFAREHAIPLMTERLRIVPAALDDYSGVVGIAWLALQHSDTILRTEEQA
jgi:glucokinase